MLCYLKFSHLSTFTYLHMCVYGSTSSEYSNYYLRKSACMVMEKEFEVIRRRWQKVDEVTAQEEKREWEISSPHM